MITQVFLRNFQGHRRVVLDLDSPITAITGRTDVGKSSIIRALAWVALNQAPSKILRHGGKRVRVGLAVDGQKILRSRDSGGNYYTLGKKEFKAFGEKIPPEISTVLQLSDLNFQFQHESPFWFGLSAPEASRKLNEIVDLGIIDQSLSAVGSTLRKNKDVVEVCEQRLAEAEKAKDETKYAEDLDCDVEQLELLGAKIGKLSKKITALSVLCIAAEEQQRSKEIKLPDVSALATLRDRIIKKKSRIHDLELLLDEETDGSTVLQNYRDQVQDFEMRLKKVTKDQRCPTCHQLIPSR